jgi:hypothetical protein
VSFPRLGTIIYRDLTGKGNLVFSLLSWLTLTTICALATLVVGLLLGYTSVLRYRAASGMMFGDANNRDLGIESTAVDSLTERIKQDLGPERSQFVMGSYGFIDIPARIFLSNTDETLAARGRTINSNDPGLVRTIKLKRGRYPNPNEFGIVVSPAFLEQFGDKSEIEFARIGHQAAGRISIPVLGVSSREFSKYWTFVILEPCYNSIQSKYREIETLLAKAGPIPAGWKKMNHPKAVIDLQIKWHISEQTRSGDSLVFKSEQPRDLYKWKEFFDELRGVISGTGPLANDHCFTQVNQIESLSSEMSSDEEWKIPHYDYVSVYTQAPEDIEQIVRSVKPLPADPVFMATLEQIGDISQLASVIQAVIFVCISILGVVVLFAIQSLRAETKRADLGLLKSIGLSSTELGLLFVIEGVLLWLAAQAAALIVVPFGYMLSKLMVQSSDELVFAFPWIYPTVCSAVLSLFACLLACWLGTWQIRRLSPVKLFPAN